MRTIIAGSRTLHDYRMVLGAMQLAANRGITPVTQVLCGMAKGVDMQGYRWAREHLVPIREFPVTAADWLRIGRVAGFRRNAEMARNADALVAVWDGYSKGTESMIDLARLHCLKVFVYDSVRGARESTAATA